VCVDWWVVWGEENSVSGHYYTTIHDEPIYLVRAGKMCAGKLIDEMDREKLLDYFCLQKERSFVLADR
jgi:hypothetical protein